MLQVACVVIVHRRPNVNRTERLDSEDLRSGTLEMMIDELNLIYLTGNELCTHFLANSGTLGGIGFVREGVVVIHYVIAQLLCFLIENLMYVSLLLKVLDFY